MVDMAEHFKTELVPFIKEYRAAMSDPRAKENFARTNDKKIADLYAYKKHADEKHIDPELFAKFKEIADELAWSVGQPEAAVLNYTKHTEGGEWTASGSDLVFSLVQDGVYCSAKLLDQIKADFEKKTGLKFEDSFLDDTARPTRIKIPRPQSLQWEAVLSGKTIDERGLAGHPIPEGFVNKVAVDALFKAWNSYQKKILAAADSPEAMMASFCELSLLLPLNCLNESLAGLSAYLKDWAARPLDGASARKTPRESGPAPSPAPGGEPPKTDGEPGKPSDPSTPTPPTGPSDGKTIGELFGKITDTLMEQKWEDALLLELALMEDPKSKALVALMQEWKSKEGDPKLSAADKADVLAKKTAALSQFGPMVPFIVKHARERGDKTLDNLLDSGTIPFSDIKKKGIEGVLARIKDGKTPDDKVIESQTAPDFEQLCTKLNGADMAAKRDSFQLGYGKITDPKIKNNALVCAVIKILSDSELTPEAAEKRLHQLMHGSTIWTPDDLAASQTLADTLLKEGRLSGPLKQTPIKPYGQKPKSDRKTNIESIARADSKNIEDILAHGGATKGLPDAMKSHRDEELGVTVSEMVDTESGSITLQVAEKDKKPYYITYCEAQQKAVCIDREGKMTPPIDLKDASPALKGVCGALSRHYSVIKDGKSPFEADVDLKDTFASLIDSSKSGKTLRKFEEIDR